MIRSFAVLTATRVAAFSTALGAALLAAPAAFAGDCAEHPLQVFEVEIASCQPLDEKNIKKVSAFLASPDGPRRLSPAALAKKHAGTLVLEGTLQRSTRIRYDEPGRGPTDPPRVDRWTKRGTPVAYLYEAPPATPAVTATCGAFTTGSVVVLSRPTECSCDTGPLNGHWCWLDGDSPVREIEAGARALLKN